MRPAGAESKSPPRVVVEGGQPVGVVAGGGWGEVALGGEGGCRRQVAVAQAGPCREAAQGCRQEAGGEGVAGADGCYDVHGEGGDEGARRWGWAGVRFARPRRRGATLLWGGSRPGGTTARRLRAVAARRLRVPSSSVWIVNV